MITESHDGAEGEAASENPLYPAGSTAADLKAAFDEARKGHDVLESASAIEAKIPEHWSDEDKAAFKALDPKAKSWLIGRHRAMEGDYTRKTMNVSKDKKRMDKLSSIEQLFAPYQAEMAAMGMDEVTAASELLHAYRQLKYNSQAVLGTNQPMEAMPQNDLRHEIHQLKQGLQQQAMQQWHQSIRIGQHKINAVRDAVDEAGRKTYPHFDTLLPDMVMLARADLMAGKPVELADLYNRAGWSNSAIREEFIAAQRDAAAKQKTEQNRAKVEAAKKAGASVYGAPQGQNGQAKRPARSIREELEAAFRDSLSG